MQLLLILLHPVLIEYLEPTKSMPNFFVCLMADFKQILLYAVFYHSDPILLSPLQHNSLAKFKSPRKNRFHKDELATASDPSDPVYAHILFGSFWMTRISISAIVQFESKWIWIIATRSHNFLSCLPVHQVRQIRQIAFMIAKGKIQFQFKYMLYITQV